VSEDAALAFAAVVVLAFSCAGIFAAVFYSIPFGVRRLRRYPERTDPRRFFAAYLLLVTLLGAGFLAGFAVAAAAALLVEDEAARKAVVRVVLALTAVLGSVQVTIGPVAQRLIEDAAAKRGEDDVAG
jgi:ABC-type sugar transport system permease subunit